MIGGIEETSASFEARYAPRSYPTMRLHFSRSFHLICLLLYLSLLNISMPLSNIGLSTHCSRLRCGFGLLCLSLSLEPVNFKRHLSSASKT